MSKFCRVISKTQKCKSNVQEPFTFIQLEGLIDCLTKDTSSAEEDFARKASYIAERDVKTCNNNEQLMILNEEVRKYGSNLSVMEEEIEEDSKTLSRIAEIVNHLEERQGNTPVPRYQSDIGAVVSLVDALDAQMVLSKTHMATINEFIAEAGILPASEETQRVIISILSRHLDVLLNVEQNLECLQENCDSVERQLQVVRHKQTQLFDC